MDNNRNTLLRRNVESDGTTLDLSSGFRGGRRSIGAEPPSSPTRPANTPGAPRGPWPEPSNDLERAYLADYLATREQRAYDADVHARVSPDPVTWCFLHDEAVDDCSGCEKAHARYGISRRWGTR
jgi:hypothetical protein